MKRRTYLAALGTASVGALAGCSVSSTTQLTDPEIETEDTETHLTYRDDEGRVTTTTVQYGPVSAQGLVRMRLSIWHRRGTTVEDLGVTVRDRRPTTPTPEIYLAAPSMDFPPIHFTRDENSDGRHVSIPDIEEVGTGTVTIEWYLRSYADEWPIDIAVDVGYSLDAGRFADYTVEGTVDRTIDSAR